MTLTESRQLIENHLKDVEQKREQKRFAEMVKEEKEKIEKKRVEEDLQRKVRAKAMEELGLIDKESISSSREPIPQEVMDKVWNRDGGKCVQCGSQDNLEFDHIIPHSKGGANTYRNLQLLCQDCNRKKSNKIG